MDLDSTSGNRHILRFDDSGLEATLDYLRSRSDQNFKKLILAPGNELAYTHYLWSSNDEKMTIEEF